MHTQQCCPKIKAHNKAHHAMRPVCSHSPEPLVVATRRANYFAHGKCTVAAVHNLSVQVLPLHRKGMGKSFGGHILGVYSWIEVLFYFNDSDI